MDRFLLIVVLTLMLNWTSSEAVRCKSLSDQCETRCQNNGCKVGICLFESCNCLGCNKRSLGDSMFQRKKYEDMYSDNVQRREENKELNGFLDQSQQCLNPPCDGHSRDTADISFKRTVGATWQDCGPTCQNCSIDRYGKTAVCNQCKSNYYMNASHCEPCSSACQRNLSYSEPVCRHGDGVCLLGCDQGYHGLQCDKRCNNNCLVNATSDLPTCDRLDGTCTFGCKARFYGPRCDIHCSNKCKQSLCERDGVCSVGCEFRILGGPKCDQPCSKGCAGRDLECDQQFKCAYGCKLDYWGPTCQPCSNDCTASKSPGTIDKCSPSDGSCRFGCSAGKYGHTCSKTCPRQCKDAICNQTTGVCLNNCNKAYYGDYCNNTCSSNCPDNDCYPRNGTCVATDCLVSLHAWYGPSCNMKCPVNCKNKVCDRNTGHCLEGCVAGFSGDVCDKVACPLTCAKLSANDTSLTCNKTTLTCLNGCEGNFEGDRCDRCIRGKTGPQCDIDCGKNCQNCSVKNGEGVCDMCLPGYYYFNKNCEPCRGTCLQIKATDEFFCDQNDGTCLYGCENGWYGKQCNKGCSPLCINRTCNGDDGCCKIDCKYPTYGGCKCHTPCNSNCVNSTCHQNLTCSQGCKVNTWGPDCSQTCSISCKPAPDNTTSVCDRQGHCLFGCLKNSTGPHCTGSCPVNCRHGCCDQVSGACLDGCVEGYTGRFCNETACGDGGVVDTHDSRNTSSLLEIIFNRLDPKVKTIKIVFN